MLPHCSVRMAKFCRDSFIETLNIRLFFLDWIGLDHGLSEAHSLGLVT